MAELCNSSVSEYADYVHYVPFVGSTLYKEVVITFVYIVFILLTIVGNLFVMIAYATDEKIHKQASNLIILHLAIADFVVGASTLTFNLPYMLYARWVFGRTFCQVWATLDYLTASVSSAMIACFTADRFLMVTKTLEYRAVQTRTRTKIMLSVTWIVLITLNVGLVYGWLTFTGQESTIDYSEECDAEYRGNPLASILYSSFTGYIPLTLVAAMNVLIVIHLRQQVRKLFKDDAKKSINAEDYSDISSSQPLSSIREISNNVIGDPSSDPNRIKIYTVSQSAMDSQQRIAEDPLSSSSVAANVTSANCPKCQVANKRCAMHALSHARKMQIIRYRRNVRAAVQLGVLVTIFALCWLPFEILSGCWAFGNGSWITELLWEVTANLQWANSGINPLLYAATNRQFRKDFARYLSLGRLR